MDCEPRSEEARRSSLLSRPLNSRHAKKGVPDAHR